MAAQQEEIRTQADVIKALHAHKQRCGEQIQQLEFKLKSREQNSSAQEDYQNKITAQQKQLKEVEKSLRYTRTLLDQSTKREALAMQKVQESLALCDTAVLEKEEAEKRAEAYKEEATQLATNIGSIMDEAAKRVDSEVDLLKAKLVEKDKIISSLREKVWGLSTKRTFLTDFLFAAKNSDKRVQICDRKIRKPQQNYER